MLKLDMEIGMTYYRNICEGIETLVITLASVILVFRVVSMVSFLYIVRCLGHRYVVYFVLNYCGGACWWWSFHFPTTFSRKFSRLVRFTIFSIFKAWVYSFIKFLYSYSNSTTNAYCKSQFTTRQPSHEIAMKSWIMKTWLFQVVFIDLFHENFTFHDVWFVKSHEFSMKFPLKQYNEKDMKLPWKVWYHTK